MCKKTEHQLDNDLPPPYSEGSHYLNSQQGPSHPTQNRPVEQPCWQEYPQQHQSPSYWQEHHQQHPQPQYPRAGPLQFPPNYWCSKCSNTGIKSTGRPCGTCHSLFGRQNRPVLTANYGPPPGALVLPPGDQRLGGMLCGTCKGSGRMLSLFLLETTCPTCHGVGRLF
ncbi:Proline/serine-rich protein [Neolecta irregularis DAH-3]|uniref:Proline/serine-rich protein n=1 Tax=Neolecta irregularis (strain DAH-3) TaxID=1198029 RepID=A0A1U7LUL2_NEOID|nr:Proline/serine-rich protein [Neolecta irregularis DAH-3]|eukprot:OLL26334.1 Proline/serine-rich protein [Neolecta irregularis DAH-3]